MAEQAPRTYWRLTLADSCRAGDAPVGRRLARLAKRLLRGYGLRLVSIEEYPAPTEADDGTGTGVGSGAAEGGLSHAPDAD